jgi:hypothetical protein
MVERIPLRSHPRGGDRRKEMPNKGTPNLVEAIISAAAQVGEDGLGKGGLVGYLVRIARTEPKLFANLLVRVLPYQSTSEEEPRGVSYETREEIEEELRSMGLSVNIFHGDDEAELRKPD